MVKTFKDAVIWCESYPYSKDNYDLLKEASELDLMSQYIENQQFIRENADIVALTESTESLTGLFTESVDDSTMTSLQESFRSKAANFGRKVGKKLNDAIRWVINFFRKLGASIEKSMKDVQHIREYIKKNGLSAEEIQEIGSVITNRMFSIEPYKKDAVMTKVIKAVDDVPGKKDTWKNVTKNGICTAIALDYVFIKNDGVMEPSDLVVICKGILNDDLKNKQVAEARFNSYSARVAKAGGVRIWVDVKTINKAIDDLQELQPKLIEALNPEDKQKMAKYDPDFADAVGKNATADNDQFKAMNEMLGKVITSVGKTINAYSEYSSNRQSIITKIIQVCNINKNGDIVTKADPDGDIHVPAVVK